LFFEERDQNIATKITLSQSFRSGSK